MSFSSMKRNRKKDIGKLVNKLEETKNGGNQSDERFWKPTIDKAHNGRAVIRFLPETAGEEVPFIQTFAHSFQGPGGWFINECLTTINKDCPVCEANKELWNTGIEADKTTVRQRKRKLSYISNIYVIEDPANPENEGKVFLYKYGKTIFDMINESIDPEFDDEEPLNPFDLWDGANFIMKIRDKDGWANYDRSKFAEPAPLSDDEDEMEKIYDSQFKINEFIDEDNFKTYEEQETRLERVLGGEKKKSAADALEDKEPMKEAKPKAPKEKPQSIPEEDQIPYSEDDIPDVDEDDEDDDETLSYFASLAEED